MTGIDNAAERRARVHEGRAPPSQAHKQLSGEGLGSPYKVISAPKHRVMAARAHEEEHGDGKDGASTGGQEGDSGHARGIFWHGCAVFCVGFGPDDQTLLDAPYDAPDVQEHQPANTSSDADGND